MKRLFKFMIISMIVGVIFVFLVNININLKSKHFIFNNIDQVPESKVALILGAKVGSHAKVSNFYP